MVCAIAPIPRYQIRTIPRCNLGTRDACGTTALESESLYGFRRERAGAVAV